MFLICIFVNYPKEKQLWPIMITNLYIIVLLVIKTVNLLNKKFRLQNTYGIFIFELL